MAIFKCKMCGAGLNVVEGISISECEYCGTRQTIPKTVNENLQTLFNRANTLRIKGEFDKAERIYEKILQLDGAQAEAYWGLILCKYGIEYVEDPASFKRVPTCHRASYDSIVADEDYKAALEHADGAQRALYEAQAKEIDRIQKEILALAQKEEKYDVFICYKETDEDGLRTHDSVIANDIYYQLTQEGFKVFYAAITLEGKLGSAYEPIIFAALNSAKVMLCIGTRPEYFNAVWVKNEWSRFLRIISKDRSKLLIPCYRDMDAYELPEEFAHLQAQDMSKIGFINDVIRGIGKVLRKDDKKPSAIVKETPVPTAKLPTISNNIEPLLKRAFIFLEDGNWEEADAYCEKVLDMDPERAEAYMGKLMAECKVKTKQALRNCPKPFDTSPHYQKVLRFADEALRNELIEYVEHIKVRNENARLENHYRLATHKMGSASNEAAYKNAAEFFQSISHYKDAKALADACLKKAEEAARKHQEEEEERLRKEEIARKEAEIREREKQKQAKKNAIIGVSVFGAVLALILLITLVIIPQVALSNGDYQTYINTYGIEEFEIPEGVTSIEDGAFSDCRSLTSVKIPSSVTSIGDEAFRSCDNLETVTFAEGSKLKDIGEWAFNCCGSLTSITIPESVTSIGEGAFYCCNGLRVINFNAIAAEYTSPYHAYSCFGSGGSSLTQKITLNIGDNVTKIPQYYFDRSAIETVNIVPNSQLTRIGDEAFYGCDWLTTVTIPDSVTSIGEYAFEGCSSLTSITLPFTSKNSTTTESISLSYIFGVVPDSLKTVVITGGTNIESKAFKGCSSLTSITIPDSVTSIGDNAFNSCSSLTTVTFTEGSQLTSIGDSAFFYCRSLTSITIPDSVTSIGGYAFYNCSSLTSITIPSSVTSIGDSAFEGCSKLTSITIPSSVTSIGDEAFYGCSSLTSITIPDSVTSIGEHAFHHCSSLTSITIPSSVTSIGYLAFSGCSSLTSVTFEQTSGWKCSSDTISASNLADPAMAAKYLKSTYLYYNWKRS